MTLYASCGHAIKDGEHDIVCSMKALSREGDRCIHIGSLCEDCYSISLELGEILRTEGEEMDWLVGDMV